MRRRAARAAEAASKELQGVSRELLAGMWKRKGGGAGGGGMTGERVRRSTRLLQKRLADPRVVSVLRKSGRLEDVVDEQQEGGDGSRQYRLKRVTTNWARPGKVMHELRLRRFREAQERKEQESLQAHLAKLEKTAPQELARRKRLLQQQERLRKQQAAAGKDASETAPEPSTGAQTTDQRASVRADADADADEEEDEYDPLFHPLRMLPYMQSGDAIELAWKPSMTSPAFTTQGIVLRSRYKMLDSSVTLLSNEGGLLMNRHIPLYHPLLESVKVLRKAHIHDGRKRVRRARISHIEQWPLSKLTVAIKPQEVQRMEEQGLLDLNDTRGKMFRPNSFARKVRARRASSRKQRRNRG